MASIQQLHEALIRSGVSPSKLAGLSEEQLLKMCSENLRKSLTGNVGTNNDLYVKNYNYNIDYKTPDGQNIKVAPVATSTTNSGIKVETFIDIAGNQYFKYTDGNKELTEQQFKQKEYISFNEKLQFMNGKLHKVDWAGNLIVIEKATPKMKPINKQIQEQKMKNHINSLPNTNKIIKN